jgi:RNA polymerase sigma-70 factor (ECF subfamily)
MPVDVYQTYDDGALLRRMEQDDEQAFRVIYERYWETMYAYVYNRLHVHESSQEIIQNVFFSLWDKRHALRITTSLPSYLFGASRHGLLNTLRAERVRLSYAADFSVFMAQQHDHSNEEWQNLKDLERAIEESLAQLPEKCRTIYHMSRNQHLSIQKIAAQLNLSTKTVENNLTQALKHLRTSLGDFIALVIWLKL